MEDGESGRKFDPSVLNRSLIALPLLEVMKDAAPDVIIHIIIEVDLRHPGGRPEAVKKIEEMVGGLTAGGPGGVNANLSDVTRQYVFASLTPKQIRDLAGLALAEAKARPDAGEGGSAPSVPPAIHRIWLDHDIDLFTNKSISTVKADAAANTFDASGSEIVWAVLDTGIDEDHPHFKTYDTLKVNPPLLHRDFTGAGQPLRDGAGHGTHVAGIIAGQYKAKNPGGIIARVKRYSEDGNAGEDLDNSIPLMRGMAPRAKLLSIKVLDDNGAGRASGLIAALQYIQELNANGRNIIVHGVNMSVGYGFEPSWFACGQSPLCVEVDRLVRSGVVVVVASGNTGYGYNQPMSAGPRAAGLDITINDPGNAELAITVGSTHRDMPHVYGVSFFSSKGPTGDGRMKPDLVAPGEKILSCQSGQNPSPTEIPKEAEAVYVEDSGTSMAAPHVSGVIASFLSIRREFIGQPERVKEIFLASATDLRRAPYFQGRGLIDLMRAIQSV